MQLQNINSEITKYATAQGTVISSKSCNVAWRYSSRNCLYCTFTRLVTVSLILIATWTVGRSL